jgi:quercetin dioxygenase-like cupin family protein
VAHAIIHTDDVEGQHGGVFKPLTAPLGVGAFKINQLALPGGAEGPEHDHVGDGQDEVYVVIAGGGTIVADGEEIELRPGHVVFCSPDSRRQMRAGEEGLTWVGIGAAGTG